MLLDYGVSSNFGAGEDARPYLTKIPIFRHFSMPLDGINGAKILRGEMTREAQI